jgi:hypothetical protein
MSGLFLLYSLTLIPISHGGYTEALNKSREAAFIQSGIKGEWDTLRAGAKKAAPRAVVVSLTAAHAIYRKEIRFKSRRWGNWSIAKDKVAFSWGFTW